MLAGWDAYTAAIGPEPLDAAFTPADLGAALARFPPGDQEGDHGSAYLAGVGNIYANEAFFAAGIDPSSPPTG